MEQPTYVSHWKCYVENPEEKNIQIIHVLLHREFELYPLRVFVLCVFCDTLNCNILTLYHRYFLCNISSLCKYMFPKYNLQVQGKCKVTLKTRNTGKSLWNPYCDQMVSWPYDNGEIGIL